MRGNSYISYASNANSQPFFRTGTVGLSFVDSAQTQYLLNLNVLATYQGYASIGNFAGATVSRLCLSNATSGMGTSAWGTAGLNLNAQGGNFTDTSTTAGSTVAGPTAISSFGAAVLIASRATSGSNVTYTTAANLYVDNITGSANTVITNAYAIYANGKGYFNGTLNSNGIFATTSNFNISGIAAGTYGGFLDASVVSGTNIGRVGAYQVGTGLIPLSILASSVYVGSYTSSLTSMFNVNGTQTINSNSISALLMTGVTSSGYNAINFINDLSNSSYLIQLGSAYSNSSYPGLPAGGLSLWCANSSIGYISGTSHIFQVGFGTTSQIASITSSGLTAKHFIGGGSAPTIAAGAGAGTGPTVSIAGSDTAGTVTVTTGTLPSGSSIVATITFATAYGSAPKGVLLFPQSSSTALLSGATMIYTTSTTTTFVINSGTTGLTAATTYVWSYVIIQ